ncbi:tRNA (adenine(37)-N6)-methyltransferase isoform X2 [Cynoglossus semilaevis]|uniref:tRNA (adenine(37)-N6)-methyltransferase isoform X2 n=1 Tax=Cynoglossus semilaevis TaxID=244447 RepID=UPI00049638A3|nr:tRNA (adenine(37)-N6)-methyltransferase isoform X2 [Cynoglossus semilaevis]
MSPLCQCCGDTVRQLKQQVSVMRREIKNLRQMLDSATRANRKHMLSLQSALSKIGVSEKKDIQAPSPSSSSPSATLEQAKNGTPRQPTVCGPSRAKLRIQHSVFNNPEHALVGLEQYSHVWVIFLFHKNGHLSYKAKVKPPRLNGQRVGVYSTRSPHRPNALGLTLAKLDGIVGDTVHLSGIDMIAGTPVLDIKPFIPDYDSPKTRTCMDLADCDTNKTETVSVESNISNICNDFDPPSNSRDKTTCFDNWECQLPQDGSEVENPLINPPDLLTNSAVPEDIHSALQEVKVYVKQLEMQQSHSQALDSPLSKALALSADRPSFGEEVYSTIAGWIREPPVGRLEVRFTPHAERELAGFLPATQPEHTESVRPRFKFLRSHTEAVAAVTGVLSADPRSVYRRTRCTDRLFFFTLDTADITCWFGQDFAEVVQVKPVDI